jgi:hypothetical protein
MRHVVASAGGTTAGSSSITAIRAVEKWGQQCFGLRHPLSRCRILGDNNPSTMASGTTRGEMRPPCRRSWDPEASASFPETDIHYRRLNTFKPCKSTTTALAGSASKVIATTPTSSSSPITFRSADGGGRDRLWRSHQHPSRGRNRRNRRLLVTTNRPETLIAAAVSMGLSSQPVKG